MWKQLYVSSTFHIIMELKNENVNIDEFLKPTNMCDFDNPIIIQKAHNLTDNSSTDKEKAIAIFNYIRDEILFFFDPYFKTASNTLKKGGGFCMSKANLQVALLRAINIPARYHIVHLKADCTNPLFPKWYVKNSPPIIDHHSTCECYLNGKWIACDAALDKDLIKGAKAKGLYDQESFPQIDWDGENDLEIFNPWKVAEVGYFSNLDDFWSDTIKRCYSPKFITKIFLPFGNKSIKSARSH